MNPHALITKLGPDLFPVLRFAVDRMRGNVDRAMVQLDRSKRDVDDLAERVEKALWEHYTAPFTRTREADVASRIAELNPHWDERTLLVFLAGFIADNADFKRCITEAAELGAEGLAPLTPANGYFPEQVEKPVKRIFDGSVAVDPIAVAFEMGVERIGRYGDPSEHKVKSAADIIEMTAKQRYSDAAKQLDAIKEELTSFRAPHTTVGEIWDVIETLYEGFTGKMITPTGNHPAGTPDEIGYNDMMRRLTRMQEFLTQNKTMPIRSIQHAVKKLHLGFNADGTTPQ